MALVRTDVTKERAKDGRWATTDSIPAPRRRNCTQMVEVLWRCCAVAEAGEARGNRSAIAVMVAEGTRHGSDKPER